MRDAEKTIGNLIDKQKVVYLSSIDPEGYPEMRAMFSPRKREGIKVFYFSTNTSSQKVRQLREESRAGVYLCDRRFYRGVLLKGRVEVLEDLESKELIWEKGDTIYYPQGVSDPDYCVLKFTAESGRYYSNFKTEDFVIE